MKYIIFFTIVLIILVVETLTLRHYGINATFAESLNTIEYVGLTIGYFVVAILNYFVIAALGKKILE